MLINELNMVDRLKPGQERDLTVTDKNKARYADKLMDIIHDNCSEFLKTKAMGTLLYRGFKHLKANNSADFFIGSSRDDRRPIGSGGSNDNSSKKVQMVCDFFLYLNDFKALRSNATFCNSNSSEADWWGKIYVIFPLNGFDFAYSKNHTGDSAYAYSYDCFEDDRQMYGEDFKSLATYLQEVDYDFTKVNKNVKTGYKEIADKFIIDNQFSKENLAWPMNKKYDLWIRGKYIAIDMKTFERLNLAKLFN